MDIRAIKQTGKEAFKANYWRCVLVAFVMGLLTTGSSSSGRRALPDIESLQVEQDFSSVMEGLTPDQTTLVLGIILGTVSIVLVVALLLRIFLFNPLQVGGYLFFKRNCTDPTTRVGVLAEGFGNYGHTFLTLFLRDLFLTLWTLLFVIPGIIKSYSYMLVPYLIKDRPDLSPTETITLSRQMMNGHKTEAFMMTLSFIGWFLLGIITLNIAGIFWVSPYFESAKAAFYLEILRQEQHGVYTQ